jgi:hypothetical protein
MGKQYLTPPRVKLIKHLHHNRGITPYFINKTYGITTRANIHKILKEQRWMEVTVPRESEGELLFWKWIHNEI